jgi:large subunit ribosomal protein L7/L12
VNDISGLTLLQAADLVTMLKVRCFALDQYNPLFKIMNQSRLNIQEIAMPTAAAAPAAATPTVEEAAEEVPPIVLS